MKRRITVLAFTGLWILAAIGGRLGLLMLGGRYADAAVRQSLLTVTVDQPRGTVYDRQGKPLTNRQTEYRVAMIPTPQGITRLYDTFTGNDLQTLLQRAKEGRPFVFSSPAALRGKGILSFSCCLQRPAYQPALHLIGYVNADGEGVSGLQKAYQKELACTAPTTVTYTGTAAGNALTGVTPALSRDDGQTVKGVITTLDDRVQQAAEKALGSVKQGAVVVQKAGSGELLAVAACPTFDCRCVAASLQREDSPLLNRALAAYNVGSVFKLCVAAAALEQGISPGRTYTCTGQVTCGTVFHCHCKEGHGKLDMKQALAVSCNPYFIDLARTVGAQAVYDMAVRLGFGRPLTLARETTAAAGCLPSEAELARSPAALANFAIGQGSLLATPVHLASMVAVIAAGGVRFDPYVVSGMVDATGKKELFPAATGTRAFSAGTAFTLQEMMVGVMTAGTGTSGQPLQPAAGKTATAQTGMTRQGVPVTQAWFVGYYPAKSPRYAVSILVEGGASGGGEAAPVFRNFCNALE